MAKKIDHKTMEYVEILAQLKLSPKEEEKAAREMQKILDYVEKLNELDTEGIEPMAHIFQTGNVFREDVVINEDQRCQMLVNAPKKKDGQFQVPKTVE